MVYHGLVGYISYFLTFWQEIVNYLFDPTDIPDGYSLLAFSREAVGGGSGTDGQWVISGNALPNLTDKGSDMLAAIMTIAHNGLVALAQLSTLLPANAL